MTQPTHSASSLAGMAAARGALTSYLTGMGHPWEVLADLDREGTAAAFGFLVTAYGESLRRVADLDDILGALQADALADEPGIAPEQIDRQ